MSPPPFPLDQPVDKLRVVHPTGPYLQTSGVRTLGWMTLFSSTIFLSGGYPGYPLGKMSTPLVLVRKDVLLHLFE